MQGYQGTCHCRPRWLEYKWLRQSRHTAINALFCPSDSVAVGNELNTNEYGFYRGNYRGCVGSGDMYGNSVDATAGPWGVGVFGVKSGQSVDVGAGVPTMGATFADIQDGTSQTLMLSEGIVPQVSWWGGPIGSVIYGNMGGSLFSAAITPNSSAPDRPIGPCPRDNGDANYVPPCLSLGGNGWWGPYAQGAYVGARSNHPGGVNVALADASAWPKRRPRKALRAASSGPTKCRPTPWAITRKSR